MLKEKDKITKAETDQFGWVVFEWVKDGTTNSRSFSPQLVLEQLFKDFDQLQEEHEKLKVRVSHQENLINHLFS